MSVQPSSPSRIAYKAHGVAWLVPMDRPPELRWWSGCRAIGLMSLGLWAGIYQIVLHVF